MGIAFCTPPFLASLNCANFFRRLAKRKTFKMRISVRK